MDTTQALRKEFNCPAHISDKTINDAWNAMLLDTPPERITMIETLKKTYRVFLLSNSNKVHIDRVLEIGERDLGTDVFRDKWGKRLFDKIYYSYEIGFRKPDVDAFEFVVNDARLVKEETLFVDDTIRHVRGGMAAGLNVWWIDKEWPLTRIAEIIDVIESGEKQDIPLQLQPY